MWSARKLKLVARSSSTTKLLSASDAVSALSYLQHLLDEVLYHRDADATFESRVLYDLDAIFHEPTESLNQFDLVVIRKLHTPRIVGTMFCSPGHYSVRDPLTKDNIVTAALLLKVLREGRYPHHPDRLFRTAEKSLIQETDDLSQTGACWKEPWFSTVYFAPSLRPKKYLCPCTPSYSVSAFKSLPPHVSHSQLSFLTAITRSMAHGCDSASPRTSYCFFFLPFIAPPFHSITPCTSSVELCPDAIRARNRINPFLPSSARTHLVCQFYQQLSPSNLCGSSSPRSATFATCAN